MGMILCEPPFAPPGITKNPVSAASVVIGQKKIKEIMICIIEDWAERTSMSL